jgi:hypothetical protein
MGELAQLLGKRMPSPEPVTTPLHVVGNSHGIARGWFFHPFNFDPVWLIKCDGFAARDSEVA